MTVNERATERTAAGRDRAAEVSGGANPTIDAPSASAGQRTSAPRRAPFVALVVLVLGGGLIGQLVLNTSLGQNAFGMHDLQSRSDDLAERQQSLEQQLARLQSPADLAERARALGMVESENPVFLNLTNGAVEGVPVPATAPPPPPPPPTTAPPTTPPPTTAPASTPPASTPPASTPPADGTQSSPGATP